MTDQFDCSHAIRHETHRGFRITVAASRRPTGAILATATLCGGPARLVRTFAFKTDAPNVRAACEGVLADLEKVIDEFARGDAPDRRDLN